MSASVPLSFGQFGQLEPLARQLFILTFDVRIANSVREFPAFCRVGAELLGSRLHAALFRGPTSNSGAGGHYPSMAAISLRCRYVRDSAGDAMCDRHHTNVLPGDDFRQHHWLSEFSVDREKFSVCEQLHCRMTLGVASRMRKRLATRPCSPEAQIYERLPR